MAFRFLVTTWERFNRANSPQELSPSALAAQKTLTAYLKHGWVVGWSQTLGNRVLESLLPNHDNRPINLLFIYFQGGRISIPSLCSETNHLLFDTELSSKVDRRSELLPRTNRFCLWLPRIFGLVFWVSRMHLVKCQINYPATIVRGRFPWNWRHADAYGRSVFVIRYAKQKLKNGLPIRSIQRKLGGVRLFVELGACKPSVRNAPV